MIQHDKLNSWYHESLRNVGQLHDQCGESLVPDASDYLSALYGVNATFGVGRFAG